VLRRRRRRRCARFGAPRLLPRWEKPCARTGRRPPTRDSAALTKSKRRNVTARGLPPEAHRPRSSPPRRLLSKMACGLAWAARASHPTRLSRRTPRHQRDPARQTPLTACARQCARSMRLNVSIRWRGDSRRGTISNSAGGCAKLRLDHADWQAGGACAALVSLTTAGGGCRSRRRLADVQGGQATAGRAAARTRQIFSGMMGQRICTERHIVGSIADRRGSPGRRAEGRARASRRLIGAACRSG
jgi:hypothetical protein